VGIKSLAGNVPDLEGLQLSGCKELTDAALTDLISSVPKLTHLDLEEILELTNVTLQNLAKAPCKGRLEHLSIGYCEKLGDTGLLPLLKACPSLRNIEMDNTRTSDLVLAEAASVVRQRNAAAAKDSPNGRPRVGLRMVVYDCQNVTWTGVREVLSRNAEIRRPTPGNPVHSYPSEIIQLKCFYGWQMTVEEHTKRVLGGDLAAASRLERKWAEYMMANEEAGAQGAGIRRRRRRARQAQMMHADEEEGGAGIGGVGRRRRARSGGCVVM
jgi:F-box/leucine-rich repeat protein 2/20